MEALPVLGMISSCISIINTSIMLFEAARNSQGLPKAFRNVCKQLPLIQRTLRSIESRCKDVSNDECSTIMQVVKRCNGLATKLQKVLEAVLRKENDSLAVRFRKLIKTIVKGHKVKSLTEQILEQLQVLQANHIFSNVATKDDLRLAVAQLKNTRDSGKVYSHSGSGNSNAPVDKSTQQTGDYDFGGTASGVHSDPRKQSPRFMSNDFLHTCKAASAEQARETVQEYLLLRLCSFKGKSHMDCGIQLRYLFSLLTPSQILISVNSPNHSTFAVSSLWHFQAIEDDKT
jgi:hypothetical protein